MRNIKIEPFIRNLQDQILEAQIKLGYAKERMRFYYPLSSLNQMLHTNYLNILDMLSELEQNPLFQNTVLGKLTFAKAGERIEVSIPSAGVEYVHMHMEKPPFLIDIITLFGNHPHCSIEQICGVFEKYSRNYICKPMQETDEFDYVIYFKEPVMDSYYYCIKREMGHMIYHRFLKEDYKRLIERM